ncbi:uncharacterized protein [Procambarus clarkii]|uniref:uncharacterized protein n=1 Tax=Procambarus clarkii TaxID=6728 RepID=UPI001E674B8B|nr:uncharacterized protein LOC123773362 [Procambarus clarkii]
MRITARTTEVLVALTVLVVAGVCPAAAQDDDGGRNEEKFFIKNYSTTTETTISAVTSVIPYLCFYTGSTAASPCAGRKLRRSRRIPLNVDDFPGSLHAATDLASSGPEGAPDEETIASDKFFFTLYRSVTTTVTVTTTSTNTSTTVSVSAYCTFAGFTGPVC